MRWRICVLGWVVSLAGCVGLEAPVAPPADLGLPPPPPTEKDALRFSAPRIAAGVGQTIPLTLLGTRARDAACTSGETSLSPRGLAVESPETPGFVEVECVAGSARAFAQVTFTASATLPVADPYRGGVALFKLTELPEPLVSPVGTRRVGLPALDTLVAGLGAWVYPALPVDRKGARDAVGLGLWVAIEIPPGVHYYNAIEQLRTNHFVHAESYLPVDGAFLRVEATHDWPTPLRPVTRAPELFEADTDIVRASRTRRPRAADVTWDLRAIGAIDAWSENQGEGVRIAVVDTGLDVNHAALTPNLIFKQSERLGDDLDGNGVPGDEVGANFAHLAIARAPGGPPTLALGLLSDVSDWSGVERSPRDRRIAAGHGTALASLAAGAGGAGGRVGAAPRATLIAVDTEENRAIGSGRTLASDPRMRELDETDTPLRSSTWARAIGVVYAVGERARVVTCAWPRAEASWLLHDVLLFAEDNCVTSVCSPGRTADGTPSGYPSRWRDSWLASRGGGTGELHDAWTGETTADFYRRPLRGVVVAGGVDADHGPFPASAAADPDVYVQVRGGKDGRALIAAVSNPRNDAHPAPDRRVGRFPGTAGAAGLTAGAAAVVVSHRTDLEPARIISALRKGALTDTPVPRLWIPGALDATASLDEGACDAVLRRDAPIKRKTLWERIRVKVKTGPGDDEDSLPGSAAPDDW